MASWEIAEDGLSNVGTQINRELKNWFFGESARRWKSHPQQYVSSAEESEPCAQTSSHTVSREKGLGRLACIFLKYPVNHGPKSYT